MGALDALSYISQILDNGAAYERMAFLRATVRWDLDRVQFGPFEGKWKLYCDEQYDRRCSCGTGRPMIILSRKKKREGRMVRFLCRECGWRKSLPEVKQLKEKE